MPRALLHDGGSERVLRVIFFVGCVVCMCARFMNRDRRTDLPLLVVDQERRRHGHDVGQGRAAEGLVLLVVSSGGGRVDVCREGGQGEEGEG